MLVGDVIEFGELLSCGLWKLTFLNFLLRATSIKSEVAVSDMRLGLFSGVPPGDRLNGVLFNSERQRFLIWLRRSWFGLRGVLVLVVLIDIFLASLSHTFCCEIALDGCEVKTDGGGGGGGMGISTNSGFVIKSSLWVSLGFSRSLVLFLRSILFRRQYFPTCWYISAMFRFRMISLGLSKLNVPRDSRRWKSCFICTLFASSFSFSSCCRKFRSFSLTKANHSSLRVRCSSDSWQCSYRLRISRLLLSRRPFLVWKSRAVLISSCQG